MAFIRWKTNRTGGAQAYLVQSYRENGKTKQKTLAYLGDAASLTPEHIAQLKERYPDKSIDWENIKPRQKPLTDPNSLSDAELLRKIKHLRLERGLDTYRMSWKVQDEGVRDFNRNKLANLEKAFSGVKAPEQKLDPKLIAALRRVFAVATEAPKLAQATSVVPRKVESIQQISASQPADPKPASLLFPPKDDVASTLEEAEEAFFQALLKGDVSTLRNLLVHDFVMVDVFKGAVINKNSFISALESGRLKFEKIQRVGSNIRKYKEAAVVVGETRMNGQFNGTPFEVHSRYTHVYTRVISEWMMVSAQGTPIAPEA